MDHPRYPARVAYEISYDLKHRSQSPCDFASNSSSLSASDNSYDVAVTSCFVDVSFTVVKYPMIPLDWAVGASFPEGDNTSVRNGVHPRVQHSLIARFRPRACARSRSPSSTSPLKAFRKCTIATADFATSRLPLSLALALPAHLAAAPLS
jgi:hypothetical protein